MFVKRVLVEIESVEDEREGACFVLSCLGFLDELRDAGYDRGLESKIVTFTQIIITGFNVQITSHSGFYIKTIFLSFLN